MRHFPRPVMGRQGALVPPPQGDRDWRAGGPLAAAELLVDGEHPLGGHVAEQGDGRGEADLRRVGQDLADAVAPVFRSLHLEDRVLREHVGAAVRQLRSVIPPSWVGGPGGGARGSWPPAVPGGQPVIWRPSGRMTVTRR